MHLKVDIIVVAGGDTEIRAAKNATKTIPIVMAGAALDPVEAGLLKALPVPAATSPALRTIGQRARREAAGAVQRSRSQTCPCRGSLRSGHPDNGHEVKEVLPVAARALEFDSPALGGARAADDFEKEFTALKKQRPDGLFAPGGPLMTALTKNASRTLR